MTLDVPKYNCVRLSSILATSSKSYQFFVSPEKFKNHRYKVLTPERRYAIRFSHDTAHLLGNGCDLLIHEATFSDALKEQALLTKHRYVYRKVAKFLDARKLYRNLPKIQTKWPNLRVFRQKDANGIANSEDPNQTAPLGAEI